MLSGHLDENRASRFRREARASARVASEHVVKVTDADTAPELGDAPFLVMELLDGEDLEERITKKGPVPKHEVAEIMTQVARGLDRAHAAGVIHRDLKPDNVFLHCREDGSTIAKLLDFGISKLLVDDGATAVTKTSDVFGTPLYMSPEQASGQHEAIGRATDIWAIALVVFRALTGQNYWTAETVPTFILQIVSPARELPSTRHGGLGPAFDKWFLKSLAPDPKDRFRSAGEQAAALAAALAEPLPQPGDEGTVLMAAPLASTDGPVITTTPPVSPRRSKPLAFLGVALLGLAIGGLVILAVVLAQPDAKERATTHASPPPSTASSVGAPASAAPDAAVAVEPSSVPAPTASTKPAKVRIKPKATSQSDPFDTQK